MTTNELKDNALLVVAIVLVLAIIAGALLGGQALRAERAEKVTAGEYVTTIHVPPGFSCTGLQVDSHIYVVQCVPWNGKQSQ